MQRLARKGDWPGAVLGLAAGLWGYGAFALELEATTSKEAYYRYEVVEIEARIRLEQADRQVTSPLDVHLVALVSHKGKLVETCGGMTAFGFRRTRATDDDSVAVYRSTFPVPWNPPLGRYEAVVSCLWGQNDSAACADTVSFRIIGRQPPEILRGLCVMNIESTLDFISNPYRSYLVPREQLSFVEWARFLGADAVWYSAAQTIEGLEEEPVCDAFPWYANNLRVLPEAAKQAHEAGLKFGAWIGCFFLWGENLRGLDYEYAVDYWKPTGKMIQPHRVSITDRKRFRDILGAMRVLDRDPNVDYIGFDYIRTGFGGYEMVDEFAQTMHVYVPDSLADALRADRIHWLALEIEEVENPTVVEKWQWWCSHKAASAVKALIEESGTRKPIWVFQLGWEHGRQHGQDPLMFNDAGAAACAVMLYESDGAMVNSMIRDWREYIGRKGRVNLLVGEEVDWNMLQNTLVPAGPEEFYQRHISAMEGLYRDGPVEGVFWHDLGRGARGRLLGPYSRLEWATAGAAAFSRTKFLHGRSAVSVEIATNEQVAFGEAFNAAVVLTNATTDTIRHIRLQPYASEGIVVEEGALYLERLPAEVQVALALRCRIAEPDTARASRYMLAVEAIWEPALEDTASDKCERFVAFRYVACGLDSAGLDDGVNR